MPIYRPAVPLVLALVALSASPAVSASEADPALRFLQQYAETYHFTLGTPRSFEIVPGGKAVLFLRSGPRSFVRDLYEVDLATGREKVLATSAQLLGTGEERLTAQEKAERERQRLVARGIAAYQLSEDGAKVLVPLSGQLYVLDRASGAARQLPSAGSTPLDAHFSPDATQVAFVRDSDLYVTDIEQGVQRRLTTGGNATLSHGLAEFVAQEEMDRHSGYWWSPDSKWIAYEEVDTKGVEVLHIADPMHPDREADPWPYPRPGKSNAEVRLGIVSAAGGATQSVSWDRAKYPYLARVVWTKSSPLTLVVQNREQTEELVLAADPQSGKTTTLLAETDPAWLNLTEPNWLEDGSGFLWLSEKSGETRLELHQRDGQLRNLVTPAGFGLRDVLGVDLVGQRVFVSASLDPTQRQVWSVPLSGEPPTALSQGAGVHTAIFARDASASVWTETALSGERSWIARRHDGKEATRLRSVAEAPPFQAAPEFATVGERGYHAAIVRPRNFQAGRKYPVLLSAYTGPTVQTVLQDPWGYLLSQWMADHGFIVVTLDGRGTPGRGREWERVIKGNLIDIELNDQVEGIQALGAKYAELDLGRVGVYGWSFGGYFSAMAAMRRPDVFKAAIAGAPVCDWRDYDTYYTERYLGLPQQNETGYTKSSVLTYTGELEIPLLIVHGTADDNVYFLHSLRMTDALFRAGKPYEFLVLPGFTHMVPDPVVVRSLETRMVDFFTNHLRP